MQNQATAHSTVENDGMQKLWPDPQQFPTHFSLHTYDYTVSYKELLRAEQ